MNEVTFKCAMCEKTFKVHRYMYRFELLSIDSDDYRPFSRLAVNICYHCNERLKNFAFGDEETMTEIKEE